MDGVSRDGTVLTPEEKDKVREIFNRILEQDLHFQLEIKNGFIDAMHQEDGYKSWDEYGWHKMVLTWRG